METERITLSQRERDRLKVLHEVDQKHLTQVAAAKRLQVTDRHVRRMLLGLRQRGDGALVHGLRGRPSNRRLAASSSRRFWRGYASGMRISAPRWPPNTWPRKVSR